MSVTVEDAKIWIGKQLRDPKWMEAVNVSSNTTVCMSEPVNRLRSSWDQNISVVAMGTCEAARYFIGLRNDHIIPENSKIVIHNFADQKLVGGYYNKKTSGAQEENVCSNTGLYGILLNCAKRFDMLYENAKPYPTAHLNKNFVPMLYNHDVPIAMVPGFTDGFGLVDILTAAAYNVRKVDYKPDNYEDLVRIQTNALFDFVEQENLSVPVYFISGAWGCGVFRNNPNFIFSVMKECVCDREESDARMHLIIAIPGGYNLGVADYVFRSGR